MRLGEEVNEALDLMAPEAGVTARTARRIVWGIIILATVALAALILWKLFFADGAAEKKHDQVQTKAQVGTAQAGQASGKDAIQITVDNGKAAAGIDAAVREALHAIAQTKGASQQIDPALDDVGRRAICLRLSAASLPDCQHMQRTDP